MRIERIMKRYYGDRLAGLPDGERPVTAPGGAAGPVRRRGFSRWENAFGAAVTAGWLVHLLLPERWFLLGRLVSVFGFGF
jgi:hypothetical protein